MAGSERTQSDPVLSPAAGSVPDHLDPTLTPELLAEDSTLLSLVRTVAASGGEERYRLLTRGLAEAMNVRYAVVATYNPASRRVRSLAFWAGDRHLPDVEYDIDGTPCARVLEGKFTLHPERLQQKFPADAPLAELGAESYLGVPLVDGRRGVLGHLFVMDTRPMPPEPRNLAVFRIFGVLAEAEIVREGLQRRLAATEQELRDLFDEAPIAYVHEGLDSRFIRANRAALRTLGITAEQVAGTYGRDFVPQTPEAQRRLQEAFESIGRGTDTSGVTLELRRRDNGQPLWIQWWSKPDTSAGFTRTMFIDVTQRVLLEREQARLTAQNRYLREEIKSGHNFDEIIGRSPSLLRVLESVQRVAPTDSTALIMGETGVGKELVARAIHARSRRHDGPFVKVNCAALPAGLVESEFFGHEKGAFTGAVAARRGRFEVADGGAIFLDEVGEVSPDVQVKLLRVLQENEFERVGGSETIRVNVRVIAATNRDLEAEVRAGRFRADLFYRLSVFPIVVPPLRDRAPDIPMLAAYFVQQLAPAIGKRLDGLDAESLDLLARYPWPGNIRELRNVLERAIILADGPTLRVCESDLSAGSAPQPAIPATAPAHAARTVEPGATAHAPHTLEDMERDHIRRVLDLTRGAIAGPEGAAKILGLPASTLRSRMKRLGIDRPTH